MHRVTVRTRDLRTRDLFSSSMRASADPLPPVGAVCDFEISDLPFDAMADRIPQSGPIPEIVGHTCDRPDERVPKDPDDRPREP